MFRSHAVVTDITGNIPPRCRYYTKLALKKNETWDLIVGVDKKGTFLRKIKEFGLENVETDHSIDPLLRDLYPELFF